MRLDLRGRWAVLRLMPVMAGLLIGPPTLAQQPGAQPPTISTPGARELPPPSPPPPLAPPFEPSPLPPTTSPPVTPKAPPPAVNPLPVAQGFAAAERDYQTALRTSDPKTMFRLLDGACEANYAPACFAFAESAEKRPERAARMQALTRYEAACERQMTSACFRAGQRIEQGYADNRLFPGQTRVDIAAKAYGDGCLGYDAKSCGALGRYIAAKPQQDRQSLEQAMIVLRRTYLLDLGNKALLAEVSKAEQRLAAYSAAHPEEKK